MKLFEVTIFGIQIAASWYWLMYALGFLLCYQYVKKYGSLKQNDLDSFLLYIFVWVIGGWRIGYVLFYQFGYFLDHPFDIFMIWKGGMSFHGGMIGVIIALIVFAYRYRYRLYALSDILVSILPIALWLGRIGNYLNDELLWYSPYSWIFPMIQNGIAHFPSPLFQAFLEWIILLTIMQCYRWYEAIHGRKPGYASAIFLIGYALLRILAERFRLPDENIWYLFSTDWLTLGMLYSIPMIAGGVIILIFNNLKNSSKK